jgi:hypothetical protein
MIHDVCRPKPILSCRANPSAGGITVAEVGIRENDFQSPALQASDEIKGGFSATCLALGLSLKVSAARKAGDNRVYRY